MRVTSRIALFAARHLPRGYWPLLRHAARRDPALWDLALPLRFIPGRVLRADLREPVFTEFLRRGCLGYQVGEDLVCMRLLRPGDLVFDVGANIGYTPTLFAHLVGPGGRVLAFEPSPRAFRLLSRTVGDAPTIECRNLAISDHAGVGTFYETEILLTSSLTPVSGAQPTPVSMTTLDSVASEVGVPIFVKIDVEGQELSVLRGMATLLGGERPPMLMFEALSPSALAETLLELRLRGRGRYSVRRVRWDGKTGPLDDARGTINYIALPDWCEDRAHDLHSE